MDRPPAPEPPPPPGLPELLELERIIAEGGARLETHCGGVVDTDGLRFPLHVVALGNPDPDVPAVGFFGGIHGLERIGTEVVLAYLSSLVVRLDWDAALLRDLESVRLVFMPIVNPGGMWRRTRANPRGVDLMRNAPVDARESVPFLVGGQRISAGLPWYRGAAGEAMELESRVLCEVVERELLARPFSVAIDCHSGFGLQDRIWFPWAHSSAPIEHLPEMHALKEVFDRTHAHHRYVIEPQSLHYRTHGDLWDHLYRRSAHRPGHIFLPMTLEMGSWLWVKKNPRQIFSRAGIFNPLVGHRQRRVLRRHSAWLEFLARAALSHGGWLPRGDERERRRAEALALWYRGPQP